MKKITRKEIREWAYNNASPWDIDNTNDIAEIINNFLNDMLYNEE